MRIVLFSAALTGLAVLGGCANVEQLRAQAPYQSDFNVCRMMIMGQGPIQGVATEEANRRRVDCGPHLATIQAMQRQQANDMASGLTLIQAAQPKVAPMPPMPSSVICTSRPSPSGATTVCQ